MRVMPTQRYSGSRNMLREPEWDRSASTARPPQTMTGNVVDDATPGFSGSANDLSRKDPLAEKLRYTCEISAAARIIT